jgi:uncharacterized membrane protein
MWYFDMNCAFLETKQIHRVSASVLLAIALGVGAWHEWTWETAKDAHQPRQGIVYNRHNGGS